MPPGICIAPHCKGAQWDGPGRETKTLPKAASAQEDKHRKPEAKCPRAPKDDLIQSLASIQVGIGYGNKA